MKKQSALITLGLSLFLFSSQAYALNDIDGVVFEEAIRYLKGQNIVQGHPDGNYKPFDLINRAEFSKILMVAVFKDEIDPSKKNCFPDVADQWFAPYICLAKEKGVVDGYPNGQFIPANTINFAEAAKMVVNGFNLANPPSSGEMPWYQSFIDSLSAHNAVPFNLLGADQKVDRSQMAQIIYSLLSPNLSPAGLELISHCKWPALATYDYFKDEKAVYYTQVGNYKDYNLKGFPSLVGADPESLQVLACEVFKDKNAVFSLTKKMSLDAPSFEMLSGQNFDFGLLYTYGKDKNGVYYFQTGQSNPIPKVDVASFEVLEEGVFNPFGRSWYGFAKDKNTGYLEGMALTGSDGVSFTLIGENIAFDAQHVYVSQGNLVKIYHSLSADPLLKMTEKDFIKQSDAFFENLNYQLDESAELTGENGETLQVEWYKLFTETS